MSPIWLEWFGFYCITHGVNILMVELEISNSIISSNASIIQTNSMNTIWFGYLRFYCTMQGENILMVELDMPNRTTRDYEGPTIAPKIQAALDAALADEDDIDVDTRQM